MSGTDVLPLKYDATAAGGDGRRGRHAGRMPAAGTTAPCRLPSPARTRRRAWTRARRSPTAGRTVRRRRSRARAWTRPATSARPASSASSTTRRAPVVTGAQSERPPDHAGWFVRPVRFAFAATDATSGVDDCVPVDYAGPDGAGAVLVGRCRDRAGNGGTRNFTLDYDATPPSLSLSAESGDGNVALSWQTSPDTTSVEVARTPGVDGAPSSVVFSGPGTSFVDGRVDNGTRYSYEVRVRRRRRQRQHADRRRVPHRSAAGPREHAGRPRSWSPCRRPATPPRKRPTIAPAAGSVFRADAPPLLRVALGTACALLQRAALPRRAQAPERLAGAAALPAQAELDVPAGSGGASSRAPTAGWSGRATAGARRAATESRSCGARSRSRRLPQRRPSRVD